MEDKLKMVVMSRCKNCRHDLVWSDIQNKWLHREGNARCTFKEPGAYSFCGCKLPQTVPQKITKFRTYTCATGHVYLAEKPQQYCAVCAAIANNQNTQLVQA